MKNIKLKSVEEKVSNCDLLTAALLKLGKVDTLDAGAVLEEMQFFETVMEQVQANLSKKLGNEVGVQGAAQAFKGVNSVDDSAVHPEIPSAKTNNASSKSYLSWRKKRSKNATSPGLTSASTTGIAKDGSQDAPTMKSLPMTTMQNPRFPRRDVNQVQCFGPNPSYMGALARLCDAAQVLGKAFVKTASVTMGAANENRSNHPPGGRPRIETFLADTCWPRAERSTRCRVFRIFCMQIRAY